MHILAVDDNITIRQLIAMTLKNTTDLSGQVVATGAEALSLAQRTPFDLIIIDWQMQPMDGQALLTALRQIPHHRKTPIIVLSADSDVDTKQIAKDTGATGWIVKPFNPVKLTELIRKLIQK